MPPSPFVSFSSPSSSSPPSPRYIGLTRCSPELALAAVEVLHGVSMTPKAGQDMTATIVGDKVGHLYP